MINEADAKICRPHVPLALMRVWQEDKKLNFSSQLVVSPLVAGLAVGIGVPILLFYVYGVVPVSLCRAGGCSAAPPHAEDEREHALDIDAYSRRLEPSIGKGLKQIFIQEKRFMYFS